ncbi:MAG: DUF2784 domain-containing protein [Jatrophihabitantaceae bacterium]
MTPWRWAGDAVVLVHFGFLAYLIAGGFLAWRWPWTIWLHALAAGWAFLIVVVRVDCPLTALQNVFRAHAGQRRLGAGFIDTYVRGTFYPQGERMAAQAAVGVVVLGSWIGFAILRRRARRAPTADVDASPTPAHG